ncbi:hypothetical protein KUV85_11350 [Nocardioides panacisoli]|uniref:hypothetical protein n=1 Tax=Nocardioides panacisoli TaxID=627624 RepID=UPI001C62574F|nr:hypothetical protein [Nocardioides panacisoli]QYJ02930.1 hypothetical protein KUV85_11350 [Nocardioides panacisoli]
MSDLDERPQRAVRNGLVALVAVSVAVGLVLAVVAFVGLQFLGFGGGDDDGGSTAQQERLSIPPIQATDGPSGPAITLFSPPAEDGSSSASASASEESSEPTEEESDKDGEISLSAGQTQVGNFDRIDLTGVYPGGEGVVLQVQRFENGSWQDFPVTAAVSNETFSTYVQTGVNGPNRFRMVDRKADVTSNPVKVTVGN